jgi:hypothetical protein
MWFAFVCVAILCTAAAIRIAMTPVASTVATAHAQTAMDDAFGPNTAAKSDRLYIPGKVRPMDSDPVRSLVRTIPVEAAPQPRETTRGAVSEPPLSTNDSPANKKNSHRRWQDANAKLVDDPPPRRRTKAKPQATNAANDRATTTSDPAKTTGHTFQCRRDAFGGLLRSLDLSPSCNS